MFALSMPSYYTTRRRTLYALTSVLILCLVYEESASLSYVFTSIPAERLLPINESNISQEPRILLVSAFFPLENSKHTDGEYADWLSKFLGAITTPVYFYTTPSLATTVLAKRGLLDIHINTSFTSPFDIPPLRGLQDAYKRLHKLDREASIHNPELYAVWNAKPWLLHNAVQQLIHEGKEYEHAFWNDAGSFRSDHHYSKWPDPHRVDEVWQAGVSRARAAGDMETSKEDMLFFPLTGTFGWFKRYWREDDGPIDAEISEGSFFGGSPQAVSWWSKAFYAYHDYYLRKGHFVGKDQTLINSLFLLFPTRIIGVWISDPATRVGITHFDMGPMGSCGNTWFYYQFFLASEKDRRAMQDMWMRDLRLGRGWIMPLWNNWQWWINRQGCRPARVVWIRNMLSDAFGKGWASRKLGVVY